MMLEIVLAVLTGMMTFAFTVLARRIEKRDKAAALRQEQMITCRVIEMKYARSIGRLAGITAKQIKRARAFPIGNGDFDAAINYYRQQELELENYYQKVCAANNVKGE